TRLTRRKSMERNHTLSPAEAPTPRGAHLPRAPSAGIAGRWTSSSPARSGRVSHEQAKRAAPGRREDNWTVRIYGSQGEHFREPCATVRKVFNTNRCEMALLKKRVEATDKKVEELKAARRVAAKANRQAYKRSREDQARRVMLVGEAVLRRVERGEWDEAEFKSMMDEALSRPADRALFELD
ncbi:hypothetical protein, partial [Burkholderia gladioli]|uniref:hypothetical protein n=2 Tax=Burkholderia gladioli TaxID=28095 RepID=UPI001FC8D179